MDRARGALWVDKYRPDSLQDLSYHQDLTEWLKKLVSEIDEGSGCYDFPHLLVYGPSGAGKKTRVMALLRELYGAGVYKTNAREETIEETTFDKNTRAHRVTRRFDIKVNSSNYHLEVNASDVGPLDRLVIRNFVNESAQTTTLGKAKFKVVILDEADRLSKDAQQSLRRSMEVYTKTCRVVLVATSTTKIIEPIRSRCLMLRVPAPEPSDIAKVLNYVAKKEGTTLPQKLCDTISSQSKGNVRRAILMLQECYMANNPMLPDQQPQLADWERIVKDMAMGILKEQTPQKVLQVRGILYELLAHLIPPSLIIRELTMDLLMLSDASIKPKIVELSSHYEHQMMLGTRPIVHIEAFVTAFMYTYNKFLGESMDMFFD